MSEDEQEDPLMRLFTTLDSEGSVRTTDVDMPHDEFREALSAVADAAESIDTLADDAASLRATGLRDDDIVALLYGRNYDLGKREVKHTLDALDELAGLHDREEYLVRLLSEISGQTLSDTRTVLNELRELNQRYPEE